MMTITIELSGLQRLVNTFENNLEKAQDNLAVSFKPLADRYTPLQEGNLRNEVTWLKNKKGSHIGWAYKMRYARRQYIGIRKNGAPFNYSKDRNPYARSRWAAYAAVAHKRELLRTVKNSVEGKI